MRHGRGCDCDVCYRDHEVASLRRQGWCPCLSCGSMQPPGSIDHCEACRLESGESKWCDCGNAVIDADESACSSCAEPPEPDCECWRGREAAAYEAEQMDRWQRELKR